MRMIRALLKVVTTAGFAAVLLLVTGPVASARILPDPLVAPSPMGIANPPSASPAASGATVWHFALAIAAAVVAIVLTLLVARLLTTRRHAGHRAVVS